MCRLWIIGRDQSPSLNGSGSYPNPRSISRPIRAREVGRVLRRLAVEDARLAVEEHRRVVERLARAAGVAFAASALISGWVGLSSSTGARPRLELLVARRGSSRAAGPGRGRPRRGRPGSSVSRAEARTIVHLVAERLLEARGERRHRAFRRRLRRLAALGHRDRVEVGRALRHRLERLAVVAERASAPRRRRPGRRGSAPRRRGGRSLRAAGSRGSSSASSPSA